MSRVSLLIGGCVRIGAFDLDLAQNDAVSLLQSRALLSARSVHDTESSIDIFDKKGLCCLYEDTHVAFTFQFEDPPPFLADFDLPGYFPLAKSSDGSVEAHGFQCPALSYGTWSNSGSASNWLEGIALKVDENLLEIYSNAYDASKDLRHDLDDVPFDQWEATINRLCPGDPVATCFSDVTRDNWKEKFKYDYYMYLGQRAEDLRASAEDSRQLLRKYCRDKSEVSCENTLDTNDYGIQVKLNGVVATNDLPDATASGLGAADWRAQKEEFLWGPLPSASPPQSFLAQKAGGTLRFKDTANKFFLALSASSRPVTIDKRRIHGQPYIWHQSYGELLMALWIDPALLPPRAANGDGSLCGSTDASTYPTTPLTSGDSLFSVEVATQLCNSCNFVPPSGISGGGVSSDCSSPDCLPLPDCDRPPVQPPQVSTPAPDALCESEHVSLAEAESECQHLRGVDPDEIEVRMWQNCIVDFCASGGDPKVPMEEEQMEEIVEPEPECIGSECDPILDCENDLVLNLGTVRHSNLGGVGPDSGAETLRYGNVGELNGRSFDLVVRDVGGSYSSRKPSRNGVSGELGSIAVNSGSSVTLEFQAVFPDTGELVLVDNLGFTVLDIDQGKKGKSSEKVEVCGSKTAIVSRTCELDVAETSSGCKSFTATTPGTGADNPNSPIGLTAQQADRAVSFGFVGVSSFQATFSVAKGWGQRLFSFAFHPGVSCLGTAGDPLSIW